MFFHFPNVYQFLILHKANDVTVFVWFLAPSLRGGFYDMGFHGLRGNQLLAAMA